jgi:UDP-N-acetylglucosamine:LPS N-acetylglucosamine transferase
VRVLVFTASIGEGHDLPARMLAAGLKDRAEVSTYDVIAESGGLAEQLVSGASHLDSRAGRAWFEVGHLIVARNKPGRWFSGRLAHRLTAPTLEHLLALERPDVVVSTYPGATGVLARMRRDGRLRVPVVSAITDLTSLHWWAAPGVDVHLITHPESAAEVRRIAGETTVQAVTGLFDDRFLTAHDRAAARTSLGLPTDGGVVVVSGGGWAVGDLAGAARAAQADPAVAATVVLCGRREDVRDALSEQLGGVGGVQLWGFTTEMPALFAAADVLVHSTAGLTVLEAQLQGCRVLSYGWGGGHIRENNREYQRLGIATVVRGRRRLAGALNAALQAGPAPPAWPRHAALPSAADVVLGLA